MPILEHLSHQIIGQVFGSKIIKAKLMHGKTSYIYNKNKGILKNLPKFEATRYHSLIIDKKTFLMI